MHAIKPITYWRTGVQTYHTVFKSPSKKDVTSYDVRHVTLEQTNASLYRIFPMGDRDYSMGDSDRDFSDTHKLGDLI